MTGYVGIATSVISTHIRSVGLYTGTYSSPGAPGVEGIGATDQNLILMNQQNLDEVVAITLKMSTLHQISIPQSRFTMTHMKKIKQLSNI